MLEAPPAEARRRPLARRLLTLPGPDVSREIGPSTHLPPAPVYCCWSLAWELKSVGVPDSTTSKSRAGHRGRQGSLPFPSS